MNHDYDILFAEFECPVCGKEFGGLQHRNKPNIQEASYPDVYEGCLEKKSLAIKTQYKENRIMKLSDLKTGMIVTTRAGEEYVVYKNFACSMTDVAKQDKNTDGVFVHGSEGWMPFSDYNKSMICTTGLSCLDIMKVEMPSHPYGFADLNFERERRNLLWERDSQSRNSRKSRQQEQNI